jgi:ferritin-like metal-binding protein YciE
MESRTTLKLADERLVDEVILAGAAETEHHEIAVYESLIMLADSLGKQEVVGRLRENLQQEQHTLEQVNMAMQEVTRETAHMTA